MVKANILLLKWRLQQSDYHSLVTLLHVENLTDIMNYTY